MEDEEARRLGSPRGRKHSSSDVDAAMPVTRPYCSGAAMTQRKKMKYTRIIELREVQADGQVLLRSTLLEPVDDQLECIARRLKREQQFFVAGSDSSKHPGHWHFKRKQGGAKNWLANPAHVAGLAAVLEQLVVQRCVGALNMVRLFIKTANAVLSSLGQPSLPTDHGTETNLRTALLRRCNVVQFALDPARDCGLLQRRSGAPTVIVWMANPVRFDDTQLVHIVNTVNIGSIAKGLGIPRGWQTSVRRQFTTVTLRRAAEIEEGVMQLVVESNPAHLRHRLPPLLPWIGQPSQQLGPASLHLPWLPIVCASRPATPRRARAFS
eukprot:SAG31_NODE_2081_length_6493_cov_2.552393_2_plen_324_part_00